MTLKEQIIDLRKKGKNYTEISKMLNCCKGTISYHCNSKVKEATYRRHKAWKKNNTLAVKIRNFAFPSSKKRKFNRGKTKDKNLTVKNLLKKFGKEPKCYLTGKLIDLDDPSQYSLDHIIPLSKGGQNTLENCGLACKDANVFKNDMLLEELYSVCEAILSNKNGWPCQQSS